MGNPIQDEIISTTARYYRMEDSQALHFICKREMDRVRTNTGKIAALVRGMDLIRPGYRASVVDRSRRRG